MSSHSIIGDMKQEFARLDDSRLQLRIRVRTRRVRVLLTVYGLSYLFMLLMQSQVVDPFIVFSSPFLLLYIVAADLSVDGTKPVRPVIRNYRVELSSLVIGGFAWLVIVFWLMSITELPPYAEMQVAGMLGFKVLAAAGLVLLASGLVWAGRYSRKDTGLTMKSLTTAWIFTVAVLVSVPVLGVFRFTNLSAGLPIHVALVGLILSILLEFGLVALPEEFFFRGLVQDRFIALANSPGGGIILTSLAFSLFHVPSLVLTGSPTVLGSILVVPTCILLIVPMGIAVGIIYDRTRSLKWSIAIHALLNLRLLDSIGFWLAAILL